VANFWRQLVDKPGSVDVAEVMLRIVYSEPIQEQLKDDSCEKETWTHVFELLSQEGYNIEEYVEDHGYCFLPDTQGKRVKAKYNSIMQEYTAYKNSKRLSKPPEYFTILEELTTGNVVKQENELQKCKSFHTV